MDKLKETLSLFLKIPAAQIDDATVIDRSALGSSIIVHRMYAKLAAADIIVTDYQQVRTYADVLQRLQTNGVEKHENNGSAVATNNQLRGTTVAIEEAPGTIGIDIEKISAMPVTQDFREDAFYTMNFASSEMAHCILQANPYASFAGLFAAKEALVKADNRLRKIPFSQLQVEHLDSGRPIYDGFNLSISHTDDTVVAVAIPADAAKTTTAAALQPPVVINKMPALAWFLITCSGFLFLAALYLMLKK